MKNNKLKRDIIILLLSLGIYSTYKYLTKYEPSYEILSEDEDAYAKYDGGLIYIGGRMYIRSLIDNVSDGDILVIDRRLADDPNMTILDSYRITNKDDIKDILNCLLAYENEFPTNWDRTFTSMVTEWEAHNFLYRLHYQRYRTDDVDLNNADEDVYNNIALKKLFYR